MEGSLRRLADKCASQVEFLGFRDWMELPQEYARADVLCVPSRYDGWGLVVPEGLAAGLPVISSNSTGAAVEFIEDGQNGWLVEADDESALHNAMQAAITTSVQKRAEMSAASRASVAGHSLQHGAERFIHAAADAAQDW